MSAVWILTRVADDGDEVLCVCPSEGEGLRLRDRVGGIDIQLEEIETYGDDLIPVKFLELSGTIDLGLSMKETQRIERNIWPWDHWSIPSHHWSWTYHQTFGLLTVAGIPEDAVTKVFNEKFSAFRAEILDTGMIPRSRNKL